MSEHVTYKGRINEIYDDLDNLNNKLSRLFRFKNIELDDFENNNLITAFYDYDLYDEYVILNDNLYEIIEKNKLSDDSIFEMKVNDRGELEYLVSYYNGGCGFSEAIDEAFTNMNKVIK